MKPPYTTQHLNWVGRLSKALQPPIQIPVQLVSPSRDKLSLESPSPQYLPIDMESSLQGFAEEISETQNTWFIGGVKRPS